MLAILNDLWGPSVTWSSLISRKQASFNKSLKLPIVVKVKVHTLDIAPLRSESPPQKRSGMACVLKGFHTMHTHTFIRNRNEPHLPLPSQP